MPTRFRFLLLVLLMIVPAFARAEDAYFDIAISDLQLKGTLPPPPDSTNWRDWQKRAAMSPRVVVKDGEGFLVMDDMDRRTPAMAEGVSSARVVAKAPAGKDVSGVLVVARSDLSGMITLPFSIPAASANADAKKAYFHGVIGYCNAQTSETRAGTAYFRYRINQAHKELEAQPHRQSR
jgi:hypothetical protein